MRPDGSPSRRFDALHLSGPGTDLTRRAASERRAGRPAPSRRSTASRALAEHPDRGGLQDARIRSGSTVTSSRDHAARALGLASSTGIRGASSRAAARCRSTPTPSADALRAVAAHGRGRGAPRRDRARRPRRAHRAARAPSSTTRCIDENAASHIALGDAYDFLVEDEAERGSGNRSEIHVDFMIGSPELDVDGITRDGEPCPGATRRRLADLEASGPPLGASARATGCGGAGSLAGSVEPGRVARRSCRRRRCAAARGSPQRLAEVVEPRQRGEALEPEDALEERRRPVADRAARRRLASGLGDRARAREAGDGRVGGDAADPRDLGPRARAEVARRSRASRAPPARARARPAARTAARTPRPPRARRGRRSRRRRARARSRCAPRGSARDSSPSAVSIRSGVVRRPPRASSSTESGAEATTSSASTRARELVDRVRR